MSIMGRWLRGAAVAVMVLVAATVATGAERASKGKKAQKGAKAPEAQTVQKVRASGPAPILVPLSFDQLVTVERTFTPLDGKILALAFSPDGRKLAAGSDDRGVAIWDFRTGDILGHIRELPDKAQEICFSGDGRFLAMAGQGKEIFLWNVAENLPVAGLRLKDDVRSLACSPQGTLLAAAVDDQTVTLFDVTQAAGAGGAAGDPARSPGDTFVGWFKKQKDKAKEEAGQRARVRVIEGEKERVDSLAFSPDGSLLAVGGKGGRVALWDLRQEKEPRLLEGARKEVKGLVFSRDGGILAGIEDRKRLVLWNLKAGGPPRVMESEKEDVLSLDFSSDGVLLVAAGKKRITFWSCVSGQEVHSLAEAEKDILAVRYAPDGSHLVSAGEERTARVWTVPGIVALAAYPARDEAVVALEQERERRLAPLRAPRGEFESSRQYEARQKRARIEEAAIRREFDGRMKAAEAKRADEVKKLKSQLYPYTVKGELGSYDADRESFGATVGDSRVTIRVPTERARRLAQRRDKLTFNGMIRYRSQDRAELLNTALVDPETGERYPFGLQVAGGAAPVLPSPSVATPRRALPRLEISGVSLLEPSGNAALDAGESGTITVLLKNSGSGPAEGVVLNLQPPSGSVPPWLGLADRTFVGPVLPGESRSVTIPITAGEDAATQELRLQVTALDADGFDSRPVALAFAARAMVPPELQVARIDISDADGRRVISKGKEVNITLSVRNAGKGPARGVTATVESGDPNVKLFGDVALLLGAIAPGETKRATFTVAVTQRYAGAKELPLSFALDEERPRFAVRPQVRLALDEEAPAMRVVKVEARETPVTPAGGGDVNLPPMLAPQRRSFSAGDLAIVIGIERYQNVPKSDFAYNDARAVKAYLLSLGFAERNIEFLVDERATLSAIRKSVESWLPNRVKKGSSRIFYYYSGHGAPEPASGDAYLVPYDGDPNYLTDTGYPIRRLYEKLGSAGASEVIVVIDSCFSGTGGRSVLAKGARPLVMTGTETAVPQRMAVLSSTQGAQISTSLQEQEHGAFTYYLLKAIREGKRDLGEVYSYIKPLVEDAAKSQNVIQSPTLTVGGNGGANHYQLLKE